MRLVWDPQRPAGSRIVSVEILQGERAGPLDPERVYRVVTNNFMRAGGDGYTPFRDNALEAYDTGPLIEEVVAAWITAHSPLIPRTDGRIATR
jgi:5'-nucleotidase